MEYRNMAGLIGATIAASSIMSCAKGNVTPSLLKLDAKSSVTTAARETLANPGSSGRETLGAEERMTGSGSGSLAATVASDAFTGNSEVVVSELKIPIMAVSINRSTSSTEPSSGYEEIYTCSSKTMDGCLVDVASAEALTNLLSSASAKGVTPGDYNWIQIKHCDSTSSSTYYATVKASGKITANLSGSTYYTQSGEKSLTTDSTKHGAAKLWFSGCSKNVKLPSAVTVAKDASVDLRIFFDSRQLIFFGTDTDAAESAAGHSFYPDRPTSSYVGMNYPEIIGTIDTGTPTVERYNVSILTGGSNNYETFGMIGFILNSSGTVLGAYSRANYTMGSFGLYQSGANRFTSGIKTLTKNADSTYTIENYPSANSSSSTLAFSAFKRETHSGTVSFDGGSKSYSATKTSTVSCSDLTGTWRLAQWTCNGTAGIDLNAKGLMVKRVMTSATAGTDETRYYVNASNATNYYAKTVGWTAATSGTTISMTRAAPSSSCSSNSTTAQSWSDVTTLEGTSSCTHSTAAPSPASSYAFTCSVAGDRSIKLSVTPSASYGPCTAGQASVETWILQ